MQRGTCPFGLKATNAAAAGAVGSVIFNDGGDAGRLGVINGTLGEPVRTFPVVGATLALGQDLAGGVSTGSTGSTVRLKVDCVIETRTTYNVIAETPGGDPDQVVLVGAHIDSVPRGPGINDNGSGSAAILAVAEALQSREIQNKVRFAWWNPEEFGLLGSAYHVSQLSPAQRNDIALNLNVDMVGSPNYVRFVYDGDNSAFPVGPGAAAGPDGSPAARVADCTTTTTTGRPPDAAPNRGRGRSITDAVRHDRLHSHELAAIRERLARSVRTATRIAAPMTTGWRLGETLSSDMPLLRTPMMSRPMKVLSIPPDPPDRDAPPMTTTAMTLSRSAVPAVGWAESRREPTMRPASAARNPAMTYTPILIRTTLRPDRRATSALPPTA
jgi:hypothetical protein